MNTPPRKRRRRRPQIESAEESYESPRRRKTKKKSSSSGQKKKKSKSSKPAVPVGVIVGIAGAAVVLIAVMTVDWKSIGKTIGVANTPESLMKRSLAHLEEQNAILASIKTEADAQAAAPKLIALAEETARTSFEIKELQRDENMSPADIMALRKKYEEKFKPIAAQLTEEIKRMAKNPALGSTMRTIMMESNAARSKLTMELRLNKAKTEVNAEGYSAVTASTELTNGMKIQFIDPFGAWKTGAITDVRADGKVSFTFSHGYLDRDRLRIPDE